MRESNINSSNKTKGDLMMRGQFFQRIFQPVPPETPLEGTLKMFILSQCITVPITLFFDSNNEAEEYAKSLLITKIHFAALLIGFLWGAINQNFRENNRVIIQFQQ
jgi:hypothetical protein